MKNKMIVIRLDAKENLVVQKFASYYTQDNLSEAIRLMIRAFGRSSLLLTEADITELEQPRYKKFPVPASY
jgi:hypothetical protein